MISDLNLRFFWTEGFLISKYLYFNLRFSATSSSSFIYIGGVFALSKILILLATISILPVGISGFLLSRSRTFPFTSTTYSLPRWLAISWFTSSSSLTTTWLMPVLSLRSKNTREPRFLFFATHPIRTTSWPIFSSLNCPHMWLLLNSIITPYIKNGLFINSNSSVVSFPCPEYTIVFLSKLLYLSLIDSIIVW